MIKVGLTKKFVKNFEIRISNSESLLKKFSDRYKLFEQDPNNPVLKNHALKGDMLGFSAFSITGDIRIVYYKDQSTGEYMFYDIGTHNQVY